MARTRQGPARQSDHSKSKSQVQRSSPIRRLLRENGLTTALAGLFAIFLVGQSIAGHIEYNEEQASHGEPQVSYGSYLASAHFFEAVTENWESEFLQMFGYVILTAFLFQKGSSESKKLDEKEPVDRDPRQSGTNPDAPGPVRRGGFALTLYEHSLSLAFLLLFLLSFTFHAMSGAREYSAEQISHGEPAVPVIAYLGTARFWFESLQNWQSEFLALASMVVLSIFLRERGSPESKPVDAPHSETGSG